MFDWKLHWIVKTDSFYLIGQITLVDKWYVTFSYCWLTNHLKPQWLKQATVCYHISYVRRPQICRPHRGSLRVLCIICLVHRQLGRRLPLRLVGLGELSSGSSSPCVTLCDMQARLGIFPMNMKEVKKKKGKPCIIYAGPPVSGLGSGSLTTFVAQLAISWRISLVGLLPTYSGRHCKAHRFWERWHVGTINAKLPQDKKSIFTMF